MKLSLAVWEYIVYNRDTYTLSLFTARMDVHIQFLVLVVPGGCNSVMIEMSTQLIYTYITYLWQYLVQCTMSVVRVVRSFPHLQEHMLAETHHSLKWCTQISQM